MTRFVIIAMVVCSLLAGFGIYYMATVDAMNSSLDGSWIWFLGATIAFVALEIYFGHGMAHDQPKMEIDPDASAQHDL
jgi:hypothetical protein